VQRTLCISVALVRYKAARIPEHDGPPAPDLALRNHADASTPASVPHGAIDMADPRRKPPVWGVTNPALYSRTVHPPMSPLVAPPRVYSAPAPPGKEHLRLPLPPQQALPPLARVFPGYFRANLPTSRNYQPGRGELPPSTAEVGGDAAVAKAKVVPQEGSAAAGAAGGSARRGSAAVALGGMSEPAAVRHGRIWED